MSTEAGDAEDWRQPAPGCGTERAVFGGLAAGYPAQGVIAVAWRTPVGTSPLGVIALAVLVFGGAGRAVVAAAMASCPRREN